MTYSELYDFGKDKNSIIVGIMKVTEDDYGAEHIVMRIEGIDNPDIFAEIVLPEHNCRKSYGFDEEDLMSIDSYLLHNEAIIWDFAKGMTDNAQSA